MQALAKEALTNWHEEVRVQKAMRQLQQQRDQRKVRNARPKEAAKRRERSEQETECSDAKSVAWMHS